MSAPATRIPALRGSSDSDIAASTNIVAPAWSKQLDGLHRDRNRPLGQSERGAPAKEKRPNGLVGLAITD
jgi:hypothetical protein